MKTRDEMFWRRTCAFAVLVAIFVAMTLIFLSGCAGTRRTWIETPGPLWQVHSDSTGVTVDSLSAAMAEYNLKRVREGAAAPSLTPLYFYRGRWWFLRDGVWYPVGDRPGHEKTPNR